MELDPADTAAGGSALNDDTAITMSTPYGTVGVFILEGGLDVEDAASQSVYSRPTDSGDPSDIQQITLQSTLITTYNITRQQTCCRLVLLLKLHTLQT